MSVSSGKYSSEHLFDANELLPFMESGRSSENVDSISAEKEMGDGVDLKLSISAKPVDAKVYGELLHEYAREGDLRSMWLALEKLTQAQQKILVSRADDGKLTALHYACRYAHLEVVKLLIRKGAPVNAVDYDMLTPLHFAARYNIHSEVGGARKKLISYRSINARKIQQKGQPTTMDQELELMTRGHADPIVACLVASGADANAKDMYGLTPLHYAAMKDNTYAARELIASGCQINAEDQNKMTALHTAATHGTMEIVKILVEAKANVLAMDNRKNTALHLASKNGHLDIARSILESPRITDQDRVWLIKAKNNSDDTALHLAVDANAIDVVEFLLICGSNVNEKRAMNSTALHSAASKGYVDMVDTLLKAQADMSAVNDARETPLHNAATFNKAEVVKFMIQPEVLLKSKKVLENINASEADPESHLSLAKGEVLEAPDGQGCTPFLVAVSQGHLDTVKVLYEGGANIFAKDHNERSCILLASQFNCRSTLQYILEGICSEGVFKHKRVKDEFVMEPDRYLDTPLHMAAYNGYLEIAQILYQNGASLSSINEDEETPMHHAARTGKTNIVKQFIEWNSKTVVDKDEASNTPLHLAAGEGHAQVVKVLLDAGADYTAKNNFERTPLDCAVHAGRLFTVKMLLDSGAPAEPSIPLRTTTPLHRAAQEGHAEVIKALLNKNAQIDRLDEEGRTCLDIALENEKTECCLAILQHREWRLVMKASANKLCTDNCKTPLRIMIKRLPDVAKLVFDNCLKSTKKPDDEDYTIHCDYEFLDDSFIMFAPQRFTPNEEDEGKEGGFLNTQRELISPYDPQHKLLKEAQLYTEDFDSIMMNHPLKIMVQCQRLNLLSHPLVAYLLRHKWNSTGRYVYYTGFSIYVAFLVLLTCFVTGQDAPFNIPEVQNSTFIYEDVMGNTTICLSTQSKEEKTPFHTLYLPIISLAGAQLGKEVFQLLQRRSKYLSFENALEVGVYSSSIFVVLDFNECSRVTGLRMHWQWVLAGFCVFFAWINLLFMIRKLPKFGIYVVMFIDVLRTFTQFFIVFALFVVSFSMVFFIWLQNKPEYGHIWWSIFKTTMMMIGEMDFVSLFFDSEAPDQKVYTSPWANILLFFFVIIMTILLMNLLVGLAVDDIKAVQEKAELTRLAMQVDLVLNVERALHGIFLPIRRWSTIRRQKIFPNKMNWLKKLRRRFGATSVARALATDEVTEENALVASVKKEQQDTRQELQALKKYIEEMSMQQMRQKSMLDAIMEKMQIEYEDRDDFLVIGSG